MKGDPLLARIEVATVRDPMSGALDVVLRNLADVDVPLPRAVQTHADARCSSADALDHYDVAANVEAIRFTLATPGMLRAHRRQTIGWIRCADEEVTVSAQP
jgi:hypothetical protein